MAFARWFSLQKKKKKKMKLFSGVTCRNQSDPAGLFIHVSHDLPALIHQR